MWTYGQKRPILSAFGYSELSRSLSWRVGTNHLGLKNPLVPIASRIEPFLDMIPCSADELNFRHDGSSWDAIRFSNSACWIQLTYVHEKRDFLICFARRP